MTDETYTYRWTSDWPAVIADHTTPEGTGVDAVPGREFSTIAPVDSPFARPVNATAKKAAKAVKAAAPEADDPDDKTQEPDAAGGDPPAEDPNPDGGQPAATEA
jgi:hypothetical protein